MLPAPDGLPAWAAFGGMASFIVSKQKQQWIDYDKSDIQYIEEKESRKRNITMIILRSTCWPTYIVSEKVEAKNTGSFVIEDRIVEYLPKVVLSI